jgi:hypothetical protein
MEVKSPLAQSFYIVPSTGIFATSVDLYFYSKDPTESVTVQLRPMKLGIPDTTVYPYSEVTLYSNDVNISSDSTVATTFTFPSPVYLSGDTYHAIVVISNSSEYKIWVSRLGELDSSSYNSNNSREIFVAKQPDSGSLFLSQSGSTWTANQYDDLKYTLRRAEFNIADQGTINFYNSDLDAGQNISNLLNDALQFNSKKIRVGLSKTVSDAGLVFGNTISQRITNATGNLVGYGGSAFGNLGIIDDGDSYENGYYSSIPLISLTGTGRDATANLTISGGVVVSSGATISNGGYGYKIGDVLTIDPPGINKLGRNIKLSVSNISAYNELIIDQVQGNFETGVGKTIRYTNSSGTTLDLNGNGSDVTLSSPAIELNDGKHIKVNHFNHGMHSGVDIVRISNAISDINPTILFNEQYQSDSTTNITVEDATNFSTFEGIVVSSDNLGYILIENEIISYNEISGNVLKGITRGVDGTKPMNYELGSQVYKYELNGISLRRINKTHQLSDATVSDPIGLDYYTLRILMNSNGKDRTSISPLYCRETKNSGGSNITATKNIQYSIITPNMEVLSPPKTEIKSSIRTVSGKSIDGNEIPFVDQGFEDVVLNTSNYLNSNRIVSSTLNELSKLTSLPGNKSLNLNITIQSQDSRLSPVISAIERSSVILTSNRIDNKILNFAEDDRVSTLSGDPSSFVYATKPIRLENSAQSIKVILSAYINIYSDIRVLYCASNSDDLGLNYFPFPGYLNLNNGITVDVSKNDGSADTKLFKTDVLVADGPNTPFVDYQFTAEAVGPFRTFSIKIVGTSTNQTFPPRIKDLRIIALE